MDTKFGVPLLLYSSLHFFASRIWTMQCSDGSPSAYMSGFPARMTGSRCCLSFYQNSTMTSASTRCTRWADFSKLFICLGYNPPLCRWPSWLPATQALTWPASPGTPPMAPSGNWRWTRSSPWTRWSSGRSTWTTSLTAWRGWRSQYHLLASPPLKRGTTSLARVRDN